MEVTLKLGPPYNELADADTITLSINAEERIAVVEVLEQIQFQFPLFYKNMLQHKLLKNNIPYAIIVCERKLINENAVINANAELLLFHPMSGG